MTLTLNGVADVPVMFVAETLTVYTISLKYPVMVRLFPERVADDCGFVKSVYVVPLLKY